jgi:hypothetical protein
LPEAGALRRARRRTTYCGARRQRAIFFPAGEQGLERYATRSPSCATSSILLDNPSSPSLSRFCQQDGRRSRHATANAGPLRSACVPFRALEAQLVRCGEGAEQPPVMTRLAPPPPCCAPWLASLLLAHLTSCTPRTSCVIALSPRLVSPSHSNASHACFYSSSKRSRQPSFVRVVGDVFEPSWCVRVFARAEAAQRSCSLLSAG